MSASAHAHHHDPAGCGAGVEVLAQSPADVDPTRTKTLRRTYAQRLRGAFARINAVIREGVESEDVFGLRDDIEALAEKPPSMRFESTATKRERFRAWLRQQLQDEALSVISGASNTWIQSAYGRGFQRAATELRKRGVQVETRELSTVFNAPVAKRELQRLYTRNFQTLKGITEDLDEAISDVLATGFAEGYNPRKMARSLTDRVDAIGKHRATVLARTEIIRAYNAGTLDRYEEHSDEIEGVGIKSEFVTAGDTRVCPICEALEGRVMATDEARSETFSFDAADDQPDSLSGDYPLHPPIHPQCRCALLPVVG